MRVGAAVCASRACARRTALCGAAGALLRRRRDNAPPPLFAPSEGRQAQHSRPCSPFHCSPSASFLPLLQQALVPEAWAQMQLAAFGSGSSSSGGSGWRVSDPTQRGATAAAAAAAAIPQPSPQHRHRSSRCAAASKSEGPSSIDGGGGSGSGSGSHEGGKSGGIDTEPWPPQQQQEQQQQEQQHDGPAVRAALAALRFYRTGISPLMQSTCR